jgi:opacity protein-like surface antigen
MKKLFVLPFLFIFNFNYAQIKDNSSPFSNFDYGVYSGINLNAGSSTGGDLLLELKTNLISDFNLRFSLGYHKSYKGESYIVRSYGSGVIEGTQYYFATEYNVDEKGYDVFPLALGIQYVYKNEVLSPYLMLDAGYNIIESRIYHSSGRTWSYNSLEEVPDEFKVKQSETLPDNSIGINVGIGTIYHLTNRINLELRYFYKYDSEIINTHHFLAGISF